jgi:hypothetical protein
MSASGSMKLIGLCIGLLIAGAGIFTLYSSHSTDDPGILSAGKGLITKPSDSASKNQPFNEIAHFLAGIKDPNISDQFPQVSSKEWNTYSSEADSNWAKFYRRKLNPVNRWRIKEIPSAMDTTRTLFYPFSGPDFIFADAFFPRAEKIILFGLESPGNIPDPASWNEQNLKASLAVLNRSIDDVTSIGFFRTNDMKIDLESASINGVTPILMLFLARSGHSITDVIPGEMNSEGEFHSVHTFQNFQGEKSYGTAVQIMFTENKTGEQKSLIYFSADVSDKGLANNNGCRKFLQNIPVNCLTLIKSASYLMHLSGFSVTRKIILAKSRFILQDDSGIAYRFFKHDTWQIKLFGTYSRTIDLFKHKYQEDLKEAYDNEEKPGSVPFKIGYNVKFNETNLLMAIRKDNAK